MRRTTPENGVKRAITDLLDAECIWWMRNQSAVQIIPAQVGQKRRVIKSGRPGMADLLALPYLPARCHLCGCAHTCDCFEFQTHTEAIIRTPQPLWIECKRPLGGVQSDLQKTFQAEVLREGHAYLLANSVDVVIDWLRERRGR